MGQFTAINDPLPKNLIPADITAFCSLRHHRHL